VGKKVKDSITIALAGQPNVGKSTVFNMLTGLRQHVGNWPGKTVERAIGKFTHNGKTIELVDLPGTYSLTSNSEEERIARDFIIREKPDVIIAILNATALERNLYLVTELLNFPTPIVLGINMVDVSEHSGIHIEAHVLEAALGMPVIPLVATKNQGLHELMDAALLLAQNPTTFKPNRPTMQSEHQTVLTKMMSILAGNIPHLYPKEWVAIKLLEGDAEITAMIQNKSPKIWKRIEPLLMQHEDAYLDIAGGRYKWIGRMMRASVTQPKAGVITLTDRIDRVATHPTWGVILLFGALGLVFWLTYSLANPFMNWLDTLLIGPLSEFMRSILSATRAWFSGLIVDGILGGAGTVITFLPILVIFFAIIAILEDVGYMARAAYVMDRFMHRMGLHGKSFLPLFLGFGCSVPAIMGSRIIEERRARILTILLAPLVPCTARMAVITFLTPAFFDRGAILITWGLVVVNLVILVLAGVAINKFAFKGAHMAFIMELPLYHLPNLKTIGLFVWRNILSFLRKAGSIILIMSAIVWLFSYLPNQNMEKSLLASLGRWLEPAGKLMGLNDWRYIVALLNSFIAKENTIATLGILFSTNHEGLTLAARLAGTLTPASAMAFLVIQMTFIPCMATLAVIKQEMGEWKWVALSVGLYLLISFIAGISTYWIMNLVTV